MDPNLNDQNQNPTVGEPVVDQPAEPVAEPAAPVAAEKCETCGADSNNGSCAGCYQPNASCTCSPKPAEGGDAPASPMGGPVAPAM